jgi:pimeloyl-ACP methyl ester carboxylesterase
MASPAPPAVAGSTIPVFGSADGEVSVLSAYEAVMDAWPIPYDDLEVATSFGVTHVIAAGPHDGPPVVLLHALFATAASWYRNVEALSRQYRIYCVDVIGEANKSTPTRPVKSMDDFLQWFEELLDGLEIDTLFLAGNSYGGFTAAYSAMKLPERVRKLVLIGPASTVHSMRPFMLHMFVPKGIYMAAPWLPGSGRVMKAGVDWMHAGVDPDPLWAPLFVEAMKHGRLINRVFPRVYKKEELAEISAPVLLILGDREVIYGDLDETIRAARGLIPDVNVAVISDAHHITAIAQPAAVNQELLRFFAD